MAERGYPGRPLQDRRGGLGGVPGGDPRINDTDLAGAYRGDGLADRRHQPLRVLHWPMPAQPWLRAIVARSISGPRIACPIQRFFGRPAALAGDPLLVEFVVEERAVVGDNDQQWNFVADRCPQGGDSPSENRRRRAPRPAVGPLPVSRQAERGADRHARPRADAAAAIGAEIVERVTKFPQPVGPGERQAQH